MFTVDAGITVPKPADQVYAFLADPRNIPAWRPEVLAVEGATGPLKVGDTFGEPLSRNCSHARQNPSATALSATILAPPTKCTRKSSITGRSLSYPTDTVQQIV